MKRSITESWRSWNRRPYAAAVVMAVVAGVFAACGEGRTTAPDLEAQAILSAADVEAVALEADGAAGVMIFDDVAPPEVARSGLRSETDSEALAEEAAVAGEAGRPFARRRGCPEGGWIGARGRIVKASHGEGVIEYEVRGRGAIVDCRFTRGDRSLELNGRFRLEANRKLANGEPVGPQTTHAFGGFGWRLLRTERSGRCRFDLTSVRHPDSMKKTVDGTICGREVHWEGSWTKDR